MAIKQTHNFDVEAIFKELGHNYSDFQDFLKEKSYNSSSVKKESVTAIHVLDHFIDTVEKSSVSGIKSSDTTKYYLSFLNRFKKYLDEVHKDIPFTNINEVVFNGFVEHTNHRNESRLKHGSFNTYISIFRRVCTFATENDFTKKNNNYKFKKIPYRLLPRYFNQDQVKDFIEKVKERRNSDLWIAVFITLLGTGLRVSELANLKICDIDMEKKLIYTLGKGKKERYIPLYPEVERVIRQYLLKANTNYKKAAGYLFSRQYGDVRDMAISVRSIQYQFLKIARELGWDERFTTHSFRHTFAVNCLKADMQLIYLSQILGHESPSTTAIYTQLLPKDLQKVIEEKYPMPLEKLINQLLE